MTGVRRSRSYQNDGTENLLVGIIRDLEFNQVIGCIKSGRNELLEKAISLILD